MLLVQRKGEAKIDQWRPAVPIAILVTVLYGLDLVLRKMAVNFRTGIICFIWI
ncbi:MAG: hypothetical protein ACUVQM_04630 [Candidatus Hadarchaeaceae archaeon]